MFPQADDWHFLSEKVEGEYKVLTYVAPIKGGHLIAEHGSGYTEDGVFYFDEGMSFVPDHDEIVRSDWLNHLTPLSKEEELAISKYWPVASWGVGVTLKASRPRRSTNARKRESKISI